MSTGPHSSDGGAGLVRGTAEDDRRDRTARLRRVPLVVWLLTAVHVALMVTSSFAYPTFQGIDEIAHTDMVVSYADGNGFYPPGGRRYDAGVLGAGALMPSLGPTARMDSKAPLPRGDRPSFDELGNGPSGVQPNQMVQHPPGYYLLGAAETKLLPGWSHLAFDQQVWSLRALNILVLSPLVLLVWGTARRLRAGRWGSLVAAVLPLTIPGIARMGGSVNNDALLVTLGAGVVFLLAGVLQGRPRLRTAVLVGVLAGLASLTKAFGIVLVLPILGVYAVAAVRHRRAGVTTGLVAAGLMAAIGAWWWIRNIILFGVVQPDGFGPSFGRQPGPVLPQTDTGQFVAGFAGRFANRMWGQIGVVGPPGLPAWLTLAWFYAFAAMVLLGLVLSTRSLRAAAANLSLLLVVVGVLGILLQGVYAAYSTDLSFPGVQPRYVFIGLSPLLAWAAIGLRSLFGRGERWLPLVVLLLGLATQAYAYHEVLLVWWASAAQPSRLAALNGAVHRLVAWAPFDNATMAVLGALVALALVGGVLGLVREAVRRPTPRG